MLVVYSTRGFWPRVVCLEDAISRLDNCNEVGSQLPHIARISRASCLKNPAERNGVLIACVCKTCRHTLGDPL